MQANKQLFMSILVALFFAVPNTTQAKVSTTRTKILAGCTAGLFATTIIQAKKHTMSNAELITANQRLQVFLNFMQN